MKKALISGITGQDGSYLAEFLLGKGYEVFGEGKLIGNEIHEGFAYRARLASRLRAFATNLHE